MSGIASLDVYRVITDLYDAAYAPREVILAIIVTTDSITVRLLGKTEQGTYAPLPGMVVHVYELVDGSTWSHIGDFSTDENGKVVVNRKNTAEWYKVVFDGTDEYSAAVSYTWLLELQPPPPQQQQQTVCRAGLWLWLLLLALLLERRREEETSI